MTKLEIAIGEIDRVIASGGGFGCVLAAFGYCSSVPAKGRLTLPLRHRRVRVADTHKPRMLDNRTHRMPSDEVWLVGERRSTGEQKFYVPNLPTH